MGFEVKKDFGENALAGILPINDAAGAAADFDARTEGALREDVLRDAFATFLGFLAGFSAFAARAGAAFAAFAPVFFAAALRFSADLVLADTDAPVEDGEAEAVGAAGRIAGDNASAGRTADDAAGAGERVTDVVEPPNPGVAAAGATAGLAL